MSLDKETNTNDIQEEKEEAVVYPYSVAVRFRDAAKPYSFGCYDSSIKKGSWVVVETQQGLEMGMAEADALEVEKYGLSCLQETCWLSYGVSAPERQAFELWPLSCVLRSEKHYPSGSRSSFSLHFIDHFYHCKLNCD